jgi:hypothetical protein
MSKGRLADCEVFAEGGWVASVKWPNTSELQKLRFQHPVTTRMLRLVVKSEMNANAFASAAELDVLVK